MVGKIRHIAFRKGMYSYLQERVEIRGGFRECLHRKQNQKNLGGTVGSR